MAARAAGERQVRSAEAQGVRLAERIDALTNELRKAQAELAREQQERAAQRARDEALIAQLREENARLQARNRGRHERGEPAPQAAPPLPPNPLEEKTFLERLFKSVW
jgi:peptidoglycan hydrolase CwlO-like protein